MDEPIRVLGVDDNRQVTEAMREAMSREEGLEWVGGLDSADGLVETAQNLKADVVLLDLDMPGPSPIGAAQRLAVECPGARVLVLSGHLGRRLIEQALEAGAWGYVHKGEDVAHLIGAVRQVARGEVALSPDVRAAFIGR